MKLDELVQIIENAGGCEWAQESAVDLLPKINHLEATGGFEKLFKQLRQAKEPGDFRGRVLEVNFAGQFLKYHGNLRYEAKQGRPGDIDFCWQVNDHKVFIEMKLLQEDQKTKAQIQSQTMQRGVFFICRDNDHIDIVRLQRDIINKATIKKFDPVPKPGTLNFVAIDLTEIELGMVDLSDCLLAVGGNPLVLQYGHHSHTVSDVVGVFESKTRPFSPAELAWVREIHAIPNDQPHPRDYIHGVIFLNRSPANKALLGYELRARLIINQHLPIERSVLDQVIGEFYKAIPFADAKQTQRSEYAGSR
ncbi:hypothetical protein [Limnobacter litoralis]|uniref:Restriction endonuclease n=1 Tax=Limnobacter litoralis TaxID=481366 RepID=A0ABQ5YTL8_9BURK|nr:hypothetical protein [Limnobacter litoralis]GLR27256.1 hypothetical protein GCM10007875_23470 [Limnobacter litoralis]